MSRHVRLDKVIVPVKSIKLLKRLLNENPRLKQIMTQSSTHEAAQGRIKKWVLGTMGDKGPAYQFYRGACGSDFNVNHIDWHDVAAIRILDYIDHAGMEIQDPNFKDVVTENDPFRLLWLAIHKGTGGARPDFFEDMIHLFRQFKGKEKRKIPSREDVEEWMELYPSGLEPKIVELRERNKRRILKIIIAKMDEGEITDPKYCFEPGLTDAQKLETALGWWKETGFHLKFAVRNADLLDELLNHSLDPITMAVLHDAEEKGIPFFINLYYLSLLNVNAPWFAVGAELAIRDYVIYSKQLVENFGDITAWEKEDRVEPGKPNAAGWILPSRNNVHRRYPEVAILIPDTRGRACGGLCSSCQRMYNFQNGILNFNLDELKPDGSWDQRLEKYMNYFEEDAQLRDILITGGDAFMNSNRSLKKILDAVYEMAKRKIQANADRPEGEKYAEMQRVRLGTRIPVYLPQRVDSGLIEILKAFREKASRIGIRQFVVQTHFISPMEVTPEVRIVIRQMLSAGWIVTNQHVYITAASRRGHGAKLRQVLNDVGIVPYYSFCVKGYHENVYNFATNARLIQEQNEEKYIGLVPGPYHDRIKDFSLDAPNMAENINALKERLDLPFLSTDRSVLNMPGVGKSLSFRTIGITRRGRRILQFDHDASRVHSPIIHKMGKVIIVESKAINDYLHQLEYMGEDISDYKSIWGYSIGQSEKRHSLYEYPEYDYKVTEEYTNIRI
ncbi:MAG: KamA family protein [Desulfobacter sp.]|nr:MAG: KamA family protein [Desulfobacter sp.]